MRYLIALLALALLCGPNRPILARGGYVRIGSEVYWSDSMHEQIVVPLPDSLKARIESGQIEGLQISHLDNWGWAYVHGDTGLMLPIHRGGIHLWPSPDGWVEHWFVNRTYWIAVRVNASAAQCTTVVALWRPSPSPSY